jgi:hypothetical protein
MIKYIYIGKINSRKYETSGNLVYTTLIPKKPFFFFMYERKSILLTNNLKRKITKSKTKPSTALLLMWLNEHKKEIGFAILLYVIKQREKEMQFVTTCSFGNSHSIKQ